jgi:pyruvate kinase
MSRRAKIVATLGPAVNTPEGIRALIAAGVNVTRFNLSHGDHTVHTDNYKLVRDAAEELGVPVAILVDLQGPKIRLEKFENGPHDLAVGDIFKITSQDVPGTKELVGTTYKGLPTDVKPGDPLLIDDGKVLVRVVETDGVTVTTRVEVPGKVSNNKGINLPGVAVNVPALSEKDEDDLRWGLRIGADIIALSFVRSAEDINRVHAIMDEEGIRLPVIAKIEKPQAVENLNEIVDAFDGIMVARGDLGVELPLDQVPLVQKRAVQLCRESAKPVIVATQMLDSMIENSRPTRAEASDVANAVLDGTDAVMLSGETSVGRYPVLTVSTMARIVATTEAGSFAVPRLQHDPRTRGGAITVAASNIAQATGAKALVAFSQTGDTVKRLARLHCPLPLLAFTPVPAVRDQLALSWGVETFLVPFVEHTDDMFRQVDQALIGLGEFRSGDYVVVVAGTPANSPGATNTLRLHQLGSLVGE